MIGLLMVLQGALLAVSMCWTYRLGFRNLAHGQALAWGGVVAGHAVAVPLPLAAALGAVTGAAVSLVAHIALAHFVRQRLANAQLVAALGLHIGLLGLGGLVLRADPVARFAPDALGGQTITLGAALMVAFAAQRGLASHLAYLAEADNPGLAELWGIASPRRTLALAAAAGAVAGLCGVSAVLRGTVKVGQGLDSVVIAWCAVALGGAAGRQSFLAGGALGALTYVIASYVGSSAATPAAALCAVGILLWRMHVRR